MYRCRLNSCHNVQAIRVTKYISHKYKQTNKQTNNNCSTVCTHHEDQKVNKNCVKEGKCSGHFVAENKSSLLRKKPRRLENDI